MCHNRAMRHGPDFFARLEAHMHQDPGQRGLGGPSPSPFSLTKGSLKAAAESLFHKAERIAFLTGFTIPDAHPPAPETDGPPGTVALAALCQELGKDCVLICDERHEALLEPALEARGIKQATIPYGPASKDWCAAFLNSFQPSHLISVEHVGPSYDGESIPQEHREAFLGTVPEESYGRCQNMGGKFLGELAAEAFHLWDRESLTTIAVGDGGNELGMGSVPWPVLAEKISNGLGGQIACRVPCDHLIVSGISNWGAYALALAILSLSQRPELTLDIDDQEEFLGQLIARGAIDGVTKKAALSVDGLPWSRHKEWLIKARSLLEEHR